MVGIFDWVDGIRRTAIETRLTFEFRVDQVWFQNARARDRREALYQAAQGVLAAAGGQPISMDLHYRRNGHPCMADADDYPAMASETSAFSTQHCEMRSAFREQHNNKSHQILGNTVERKPIVFTRKWNKEGILETNRGGHGQTKRSELPLARKQFARARHGGRRRERRPAAGSDGEEGAEFHRSRPPRRQSGRTDDAVRVEGHAGQPDVAVRLREEDGPDAIGSARVRGAQGERLCPSQETQLDQNGNRGRLVPARNRRVEEDLRVWTLRVRIGLHRYHLFIAPVQQEKDVHHRKRLSRSWIIGNAAYNH